MKPISIIIIVIVLNIYAIPAMAQDVPNFFKNTYPQHALKSALEAGKVLQGKEAKLDPKYRELIALAVAAQIPCNYCIYAHTKKAIAQGASDEEIREAVATAAYIRQWSTVLNGMGYDFETFKAEFDQMLSGK